MGIYIVQTGDTFATISTKKYGTPLKSKKISDANPGLTTPLTPGISIIVPPDPEIPKDIPQQTIANDPNEVAVMIDGIRFRFWTGISFTRHLDSINTMTLSCPFEPENLGIISTFEQLTYKTVIVTVGGEPVFTGTMMGIDPALQTDNTLAIEAYSLPGVLNDCPLPGSALTQSEFTNSSLLTIAQTLCGIFGIGVIFNGNPGPVFEKVAIKPTETILTFLTKLAGQRNLIINSTPEGLLRFEKSVSIAPPVAFLKQGESPVLGVDPQFKPQEYYSHITGIVPASSGVSGMQYTKVNSYLQGVLRPFTFISEDATRADLQESVRAKMGRMFGNVVEYTLPLDTWRDPQGQLWDSNTIINLLAPRVMIYSSYNFLVRSITFSKGKSETASIKLVLPGSFSGRIPGSLPWL